MMGIPCAAVQTSTERPPRRKALAQRPWRRAARARASGYRAAQLLERLGLRGKERVCSQRRKMPVGRRVHLPLRVFTQAFTRRHDTL